MLGLYATTDRVVSFLSSIMYSSSITPVSRADDRPKDDVATHGIPGTVIILLVGLVTFAPIRPEIEMPERPGRAVARMPV